MLMHNKQLYKCVVDKKKITTSHKSTNVTFNTNYILNRSLHYYECIGLDCSRLAFFFFQ